MTRSRPTILAAALAAALAPASAWAAFHLMQIEQVIGGVCGNAEAQAIQLRMRAVGQNLVTGADLVAHDAAGANPVTLFSFPGNVGNSAAGSRILVATADFPLPVGVAADFVLPTPIPGPYLSAGKLTFEHSLVYWSLAWGGAAYTGTNTGALDNDADGNFNPPFPGVLPWTTDVAARFTGAAGAMSTNNAADYALSASPATLTNNAGASGAVPSAGCIFGDGFETATEEAWLAVP